jgi:hypothetical protein
MLKITLASYTNLNNKQWSWRWYLLYITLLITGCGSGADPSAPHIVSAISISNTEVLVQFSKAVVGGTDGAENPANYSITTAPFSKEAVGGQDGEGNTTGGGTATEGQTTHLPVHSAVFSNRHSATVLLTTASQSSVGYKLTVINIRDEFGTEMAVPTIAVDPSSTNFVGTDPGAAANVDSDGDGLRDHVELLGWTVIITNTNGTLSTRHVSSDPGDPNQAVDSPTNVAARDTDSDGVTDNEELHGGIDPRNPDSDGDTLTDNQEWNIIYSDPTNQDTDGDGTQDGFEFYSFRTSPTLADTDGDQISDTDEILGRNRDPRIADLPRAGIKVGEVRLQIDERFTYEDAQGETVTSESSSSSSLTQGTDTTFTTSNTDVTEFVGTTTLLGGWESKEGRGSPTPWVAGSGPFINVGRDFQYTDSTAFSTDKASAIASQRVHEQSLNKTREFNTSSTVTREIVGARIDVDLTIKNEGGIAFTISNLEITVLQRDRQSTSRFVPVATLIANSTLITGGYAVNDESASYNLGPFTTERGPILFSSRDVFPNLVDELMKSPSGLIFKVANFDITDEFGRVFTFANQLARDRTAGITVDFGDGVEQKNLLATATQPDPEGFGGPAGGIVGGFFSDGSPKGISLDFALQDIMKLNKNASVEDGIVAGPNREAQSIAAGDDVQLIPPGTTGVGVGSIVISSGQNGLLESVPLGDDEAGVTTGYETSLTCDANSSNARETCSADSQCSASATGGGFCNGPEILVRFGGNRNGDFNRVWVVLTNRETPAGADFGKVMLKPGTDITLAFIQDLDEDGLFAREEYMVGSTDSRADNFDNALFGINFDENALASQVPDGLPDSRDTDRDGLGDFAEVRVGWKVSVEGALYDVFPSPRLRDSDGDGLQDPEEFDLSAYCLPGDSRVDALCAASATPPATDPNVSDTDVDGVSDFAELNGFDIGLSIRDGGNNTSETQANGDDVQRSFVGSPLKPGNIIVAGTNGIRDTIIVDADDAEIIALNASCAPSLTPLKDCAVIGQGGVPGIQSSVDGDDQIVPGGIVILPGFNGIIDSTPGGDDRETVAKEVVTDPLRRDTDSDSVSDGDELALGGDPTNPFDGQNFRDSDQDGLTDAEEDLGWLVIVDGATPVLVKSNLSLPDSDRDGLPDFIERDLRTNPNNPDTDGDGLTDFDEMTANNFTRFFGLNEQFPGFSVDGASSAQYGTDATKTDTDGDLISDYDELLVGYTMLLRGESSLRQIFTNPLTQDTDYDGRTDYAEMHRDAGLATPLYVLVEAVTADACSPLPCGSVINTTDGSHTFAVGSTVFSPTLVLENGAFFYLKAPLTISPTDATDADTDDDGSSDGQEFLSGGDPLVPDLVVTVKLKYIVGNRIDTDPVLFGILGTHLGWWFTTQGPNDTGPVLFSDATMQTQEPTIPLFGLATCRAIDVVGGAVSSFDTNSERKLTLRQGESFTLNGIVTVPTVASADCGTAPRYIPTTVYSATNCSNSVNETFSFEDFIRGTSGRQYTVSANSLGCDVDVIYTISVQ